MATEGASGSVVIKVDWDGSDIKKEVQTTRKQIETELNKTDAEVEPEIETAKAEAEAKAAADKIEQEFKDAGDKINKDMKDATDSMADGFKTIGVGVAGVAAAITGVVFSTQEYREDLAKLENNAITAGQSLGGISEELKELNAISEETDSNVEALSNLMEAGFTGEQLSSVVDSLSGAVLKFPDTLKIEGLADGLQETLATGAAIGTFGELLERLGYDLEDFDKGLEKAAKSGTELDYIMEVLADTDLSALNEQYRENNEELIASKDAQFEFNEAMAELGTELTPVVTEFTTLLTELVKSLIENKDTVLLLASAVAGAVIAYQGFLIIKTIVALFTGLKGVIAGTTTVTQLFNTVLGMSPIGILIIAIGALVGAFIYLWNTSEEFRLFWINLWEQIKITTAAVVEGIIIFFTQTLPQAFASFSTFLNKVFATNWAEQFGFFGNILNAFFANFQNVWQAMVTIFFSIINFIRAVFAGDWAAAWQFVQDIFKGIFDGLVAIAKSPINLIIGLINGLIGGINTAISGLNALQIKVPDWVPGIGGGTWGINIPNIPNIPYLAQGGIVPSATLAMVGEAGTEAVIPLERNTGWMELFAQKLAPYLGGTTTNAPTIIFNEGRDDPDVIAKKVRDILEFGEV